MKSRRRNRKQLSRKKGKEREKGKTGKGTRKRGANNPNEVGRGQLEDNQ